MPKGVSIGMLSQQNLFKEIFLPVSVCWWASVLWPPAVQDLGVPGPGCLDIWKEIPELCLSLSLFSTADKSPGNRSGASKIFGTCWSQQLSLEFPGRFFAQLPVLAAGGDTHPTCLQGLPSYTPEQSGCLVS